MEVWKDIENFEGLYQVSSEGKIKSLERVDRKGRIVRERIMHTHYDAQGYVHVKLNKDAKQYTKYVHRLVAQAFIPNPENKETVNHKDENKANNTLENLEWMTMKENANYGTRNERTKAHTDWDALRLKLSDAAHKKKIYQLKDGKIVKEWNSITEASRFFGVSLRAIQCVLRGENPSCKGFQFAYAEREVS